MRSKFDEFVQQIELEKANPGLITMVDYLMNFDTLEEKIQEMARKGDFGTITQIQVNYRHPINIADDKVWKLAANRMGRCHRDGHHSQPFGYDEHHGCSGCEADSRLCQ